MKKAIIVCLALALSASLCLAANPKFEARVKANEKILTETPQPSNLPGIYQEGKALLNEGFEAAVPPTGWQAINILGANVWTQTNTVAYSGTYSAFIDYQTSGGDDWLITPPLYPLSATDSITFWLRKRFVGAYPPDFLYIKVSNTDSATGSFGAALLSIDVANMLASTWVRYAVDLGAYNGQRIYVAFHHQDTDGNGCYLDDVTGPELTQPSFDHDLSLNSIDVPASAYMDPNVAFTPTVSVRNRGNNPESDFQVIFDIDDGAKALVYTDTVFVTSPDSIPVDSIRQYTFTDFTPLDLTNYDITATVVLAGDVNSSNDDEVLYFRTFNELQGNVGDDNAGGAAVDGAKIKLTGAATDSTFTDASGDFSFFDLTAGTYTVTASKAGYVDEVVSGVVVTDQAQTTQDISMGYPVLILSPTDSIYASLLWGAADSTTWQFMVTNDGTRDLDYDVFWPESTVTKAPVSLILDDGSADNNIGIGGLSEMLWVNRFTPAPAEFPFRLQQVQIYFESGTYVNVGDGMQVVVYENTTGNTDPAVGSNWLYSYPTTVQALDAWNVYDLPDEVLLNGPGDVVIGAINTYLPGSSYFPAAIDQTVSQQRSWAGWWTTPTHPEPPNLPPDDSWVLIDAYFPGNWMVRGYGETGSGNAAWLDISPSSGTVGPYKATDYLNVTFDAAGLDSLTDWVANVKFRTNADADQFVPAFMHVLGTGVAGEPTKPLSYAFALNSNRPNPVMGKTTFNFTLPQAQDYRLSVYNIAGQLVQSFSGKGSLGVNKVTWNADKVGTGVYFYQLASGGKVSTRKLVVVK